MKIDYKLGYGNLRALRGDRSVLRSNQILGQSGVEEIGGWLKWLISWSEWQDSNLRPLRPEPGCRAMYC
jgi:hypothetical protein